MNKRTIVAIIIEERKETAVKLQQVMTGWGCLIKTRIGLHDDILENCTQTGLTILEMRGEEDQIEEFIRKINLIKGVKAEKMVLEL